MPRIPTTAIVLTKPTVSELSLAERQAIVTRTQAGESAPAIARAVGCCERTVRRWRARARQAEQTGADLAQALAYHARRPQTPHPATTPPAIVERIRQLREQHPGWGARLIHRHLRLEGHRDLPSERTVHSWLRRLGFGRVRPTPRKALGWRPPTAAPDPTIWEVDHKQKGGSAI